MTEPDNFNWWSPTGSWTILESGNWFAYKNLYNETYQSISSVLRTTQASLNLGNFLIPLNRNANAWPIKTVNAIPTTCNINTFSYSMYAQVAPNDLGAQMGRDPRTLGQYVTLAPNGLRAQLKAKNRYTNAKINLDETGLYFDENGITGGVSADGTHLGAAWLAAILKKSFDENIYRYTLWEDFHDNNQVISPLQNTLRMFTRLRDGRRVSLTGGNAANWPYIDGIASKRAGRLDVIVFNYYPNHTYATKANVTMTVKGLLPNKKYRLKEYIVDATRGPSRQHEKRMERQRGFLCIGRGPATDFLKNGVCRCQRELFPGDRQYESQ
jgi:hypothetical protein